MKSVDNNRYTSLVIKFTEVLAISIKSAYAAGPDPFLGCGVNSINTALGCIPVGSPSAFVMWAIPRLLTMVGGIAFLLMLFGAIQIIVSNGDPKQVQSGSQMITSAIGGLVFAIFSLFILRLVAIDILHIPGIN